MTRSPSQATPIVLLLVAVCAWVGCQPASRSEIYPVSGNVSYRGKPLTGAAVTFMGARASRAAIGKTDEGGNFRLTTFEPNDGAMVGSHEVTIKKYASDPPPLPTASATGEADAAAEAKYMAEMTKWYETAKSAIPKKYTQQRTSGLSYEVVAGENDFKIELKD